MLFSVVKNLMPDVFHSALLTISHSNYLSVFGVKISGGTAAVAAAADQERWQAGPAISWEREPPQPPDNNRGQSRGSGTFIICHLRQSNNLII